MTERKTDESYLAHPWQEDAEFVKFVNNPKANPTEELRAYVIAEREKRMRQYEENVKKEQARSRHVPTAPDGDENETLRQTLRALVEKVHYTLHHPAMNGAMMMAWVHGMEYDGPTVKDEMLAAQRLLGMPDELPKPEYPEELSALLIYPDGQGHDMSVAQLAFVGTGKECGDFIDKHPDEQFVFAWKAKMFADLPKWVPTPPHEPCAVTPEMIVRVREETKLPISECKAMLEETHGNVRRSIRNLHELYREEVVVPQPPAASFEITVKKMKRVAELTGAPMARCKQTLRTCQGDVAAAVDHLLELKEAGGW
jgi:hypothetical protein